MNQNGTDKKLSLTNIVYTPPQSINSLNVYLSPSGNDTDAANYITTGGTNGDAVRKQHPYKTLTTAIRDMSKIRSDRSGFVFRLNVAAGTYVLPTPGCTIAHPDCSQPSGNYFEIVGPSGTTNTAVIDVKNVVCPGGTVESHVKYTGKSCVNVLCNTRFYNIKITNSLCGSVPYSNPKSTGWEWLDNTNVSAIGVSNVTVYLVNVMIENVSRIYAETNATVFVNSLTCKNMSRGIHGSMNANIYLYKVRYEGVYRGIHTNLGSNLTLWLGVNRSVDISGYVTYKWLTISENGSVTCSYALGGSYPTRESVLKDKNRFIFDIHLQDRELDGKNELAYSIGTKTQTMKINGT